MQINGVCKPVIRVVEVKWVAVAAVEIETGALCAVPVSSSCEVGRPCFIAPATKRRQQRPSPPPALN